MTANLDAQKSNPGGQLAPDEVVGRDLLISRLWGILERQSLILTAERRMGKTSIIQKMAQEPQEGMQVFPVRDLEAVRSPLEFVDFVLQDARQKLSLKDQAMQRTQAFLQQMGGTEAWGVKLPQLVAPHWKTILTKIMEDLTKYQAGLQVFLWDELPMMLDNIQRDQGETAAMEVLDTLRALRQTLPNIRMVFTGSIGLHHVLKDLKQAGYNNPVTNDMDTQDVPPLDMPDACDLVQRLLRGEEIAVADSDTLAMAIATAVDCFPYYIHHVVDALKWDTADKITPARVNEIAQKRLCDDADRWDLAHYCDRINIYYGEDHRLALAILDELAVAKAALRDLCDRLNMHAETEPEAVRQLLTLLRRDHYIAQQPDGVYRFKFGLIQRYWRLNRGL